MKSSEHVEFHRIPRQSGIACFSRHCVSGACAPVLWSFNKLRELWDLSYLGFTLCLSTLLILELIEAVRGRLIGPKSWDRNVRIFGARSAQYVAV